MTEQEAKEAECGDLVCFIDFTSDEPFVWAGNIASVTDTDHGRIFDVYVAEGENLYGASEDDVFDTCEEAQDALDKLMEQK